ncbi:gliding motility protein GldL [Plebeiibacterium marinum]|uniref:Gliding motility protein GldL n=1 Tax=Plebeiibacterium marinum TaxID=2992111 RepID=A0AAE3MF95_9BACT|nr:gliding motility protein GldL [Plebeiobacterium marinum]MCW3806773.1 gliding motility protein GldL [Plebeiobacterium marinum]
MSITEFVESPGYKKVMGKVYGIGAAVVILGALWKILHLPGAALMLIAGLGTEAIIFLLSAFEPPHEMPDWSLVYPELVGLEPKDSRQGVGGGGSELQALIQTGNIDERTVAQLSEGIKKLGTTSSQLADLSDASLATQSYLQNIQNASESVGKFGNIQAKTAQVIEESASTLASSYSATASAISESGTKVANDLAQSGESLINGMNSSGEAISSAYSKLSSSIEQNAQGISENSKLYGQKLEEVNSNLAAVNSLYELQLKGSKSQVEATEELTSGITEIKEYLKQSVEDAKDYRDQVAALNKTVGELNTIYGNMLSAMNVGGNR